MRDCDEDASSSVGNPRSLVLGISASILISIDPCYDMHASRIVHLLLRLGELKVEMNGHNLANRDYRLHSSGSYREVREGTSQIC